MSDLMSEMALTERRDGFDYDYWMNCKCGGISRLSSAEYLEGANGSRMACEHCDKRIHYGPAVAALRDRDDPALRDDVVSSLAWYHTSTSPDWPSPEYAARLEKGLSWVERDFGISRERFVSEQTSKALHVGTYETAIENMLRRMHDQGDGDSQFYLHRVAFGPELKRINAGYRDENHEIASDVSISELDEQNLDAVRYLNVHEAAGVVSLAVRPDAVGAVQSIPIPLEGLGVAVPERLIAHQVEALQRAMVKLDQAEAEAASIDHRKLRMMQLGARPDPSGLATLVGRRQLRVYERWQQLEDRLADRCLPHVSGVIRRDFNEAMAHRRSEDVVTFVDLYRSMAALLEHSADVINAVASQPWRIVR